MDGERPIPPLLDAPTNTTLASRIAEHLKRQIVTGALRAGQKLVEKEIAAACNVSRTPLREALGRLVNEGLAVSIPYRGIFVREIDVRQMREIYELRIAIEGLAASLAATRASPADLDALQALLDAMDAEPVDHAAAGLKLLNERFHRKIAEIADNSLLTRQMDEIWSRVSLARTENWSATGRGETSRFEHHSIFHAIRDGNADAARQLAEAHVRAAWADVEPFLER